MLFMTPITRQIDSMRRTTSMSALAATLTFVGAVATPAAAQELFWQVSPYLTLTDPEEWKFSVRLQVDNYEDTSRTGLVEHATKVINVESGTVYYPIAPASSHAQTFFDHTEGQVLLNDVIVDDTPTIFIDRGQGVPMPGGAFLAQFDLPDFERVSEMTLLLTTFGRSWETIYNEEEAAKVPWPAEWPPIAQSLFEPEMYIDYGPFGPYDLAPLKEKVMEWTEGNPKAVPPAVTAKWLAWKVAEAYRPTNKGYAGPSGASTNGQSTSLFAAFLVDGPAFALERGQGSRFNLPVLLAAAYRAAGIPARVVIGYNFAETRGKRMSDAERLHAWVEFALYDPAITDEKQRLTWVPVDIIELQSRAVWRQPFDKPIRYFGSNKDLAEIVPIAFSFSPYWISGVSYGRYAYENDRTRLYYTSRYDISREARFFAPSLWSWNVMPAPPAWAGQWFNFSKDSPQRSSLDPLPADAHRGAPPRRP